MLYNIIWFLIGFVLGLIFFIFLMKIRYLYYKHSYKARKKKFKKIMEELEIK